MFSIGANRNKRYTLSQVQSFSAIIGTTPQILILGSAPGQISLQKQQYFAHPRNAFWRIMAELFDFDDALNYPQRVSKCQQLPLIIWDVLASCQRKGSLDSAIQKNSIQINDFATLFEQYPSIHSVFCNGATAYRLFTRNVRNHDLNVYQLPSTSPANARMTYTEKLIAWSMIKETIHI